ncbi:MAG: YicC/YloC family endoribonuclease [Candidatus Omnitrophota bacterium]
MLRSMTGFGKGVAENSFGRVKIEIKSLNYKFFEVVSRIPGSLTIFEDKIRECIHKSLSRGRLNFFLNYDHIERNHDHVSIDKEAAQRYYNMLKGLKRTLKLEGDIALEQIVSLPGVIVSEPKQQDPKKLWPLIEKALKEAVEDLLKAKKREGAQLKKELLRISRALEASLDRVKKRAAKTAEEYKKRLIKNVKGITKTKRLLSPERIEEEVAIFARNCDIAEELHRLSAHIANFRKALHTGGEAGRRLDFIAQEMNREINTIGAKANDFPVAREVIKMKSFVEKIREQAQNVE